MTKVAIPPHKRNRSAQSFSLLIWEEQTPAPNLTRPARWVVNKCNVRPTVARIVADQLFPEDRQ